MIVTFTFRDEAEAGKVLKDAGFSIGRNQAHAPRGVLYGNFDIQKWRNLTPADRAVMDAVWRRDLGRRHVDVRFSETCNKDGLRAVMRILAQVAAEAIADATLDDIT